MFVWVSLFSNIKDGFKLKLRSYQWSNEQPCKWKLLNKLSCSLKTAKECCKCFLVSPDEHSSLVPFAGCSQRSVSYNTNKQVGKLSNGDKKKEENTTHTPKDQTVMGWHAGWVLPPKEGVSPLVNRGWQRAITVTEGGRGGRRGQGEVDYGGLNDRGVKGRGGKQVLEEAVVAVATQLSWWPDSAKRGGRGGRWREKDARRDVWRRLVGVCWVV